VVAVEGSVVPVDGSGVVVEETIETVVELECRDVVELSVLSIVDEEVVGSIVVVVSSGQSL